MPFPNRIEIACTVCKTVVPVGSGLSDRVNGKWETKCKKCAGIPENVIPKVEASFFEKDILFKPTSFLGGDLFSKYREATDGAKFEPEPKGQRASFDLALKIIPKLKGAGFVVDLHPDIVAALQARASQQKSDILAASNRITEVDAKLRARGLFLFPFQAEGVAWLVARLTGLLADDMGLGKTIQLAVSLPSNVPVVIVCPAVAKGVWEREIKKWRPDFTPVILNGRNSFRWPQPGELVVVNFDILPNEPPPNCPKNTVLVADEAHNLTNSKALRTARWHRIKTVVRAEGGRVYIMTATPMKNRPQEIWNILQTADLATECFGSWKNFVRLFNGVKNEWGGYEWGLPLPEVAERLRRVMLRREKKDVLDQLPEKTYEAVPVEIDGATKKLLDKANKALSGYTRFSRILGEPVPPEIQVARALRAEIEKAVADLEKNGLSFEEISAARAALAKAKIPFLLEMVEEYEAQEEPVLVFSAYRAPIDMFENRPGWRVITGDTDASERTKIEDEFQAGKLKGIAGTIRACGVAITLTRAHHEIFVDREWNPALNEQAEDREVRIGQTKGVIIKDLVAKHPLDEMLYEILAKKTRIIKGSVGAATVKKAVTPTAPVVDYEALAADVEKEMLAAEEARKEAEERAQRFAELQKEEDAKNERERAENEKKRSRRKLEKTAAFRTRDGSYREEEELQEPRGPQNAREDWAQTAVIDLAALDPDRALELNDVGFNKADGGLGHMVARILIDGEGLTDRQWRMLVGMLTKYHRQVGQPPR